MDHGCQFTFNFYLFLAEAMGFRDWCESECVRLIGTRGMFNLAGNNIPVITYQCYFIRSSKLHLAKSLPPLVWNPICHAVT